MLLQEPGSIFVMGICLRRVALCWCPYIGEICP